MEDPSKSVSTALPCVVQVGFAGSRRLFDNPPVDADVEAQWNSVVLEHVLRSLDEMRVKLALQPQHFLCGISQIACGADTIFTRACSAREVPQRIFLPQALDDYLSASSSNGEPDFTPTQEKEARSLLTSPHIIQERVVSFSQDRSDRFRETNAQILRVSDVVICLLRVDAEGKAGGTNELLQRASEVKIPALEIRVGVADGKPVCQDYWHVDGANMPPSIPKPLTKVKFARSGDALPSSEEYCVSLKKLVSTQAKLQQRLFKYAAVLIIAAHILATFCATVALALHGLGGHGEHESHPASLAESLIPWLLGVELVLLAAGFVIHQYLHHSKAASVWANARVVAELSRSIQAIHPRHLYLEHLFRLPLPHRFRSLLRTLSVLHLRSTRTSRNDPWKARRDTYVSKRIDHQIDFYEKGLAIDKRRLKRFRRCFLVFSTLAMAATAAKLYLILYATGEQPIAAWPQLLGTLAIMMPVLAVAGLSWLAALDCEARVETFEETHAFLHRQQKFLACADTGAEFDRLIIETEAVLLGEVINWFSRRANTGVT